MSEPTHSGRVFVSRVDLGLLIGLALSESGADLGPVSQEPDGTTGIEAVHLARFLSWIRGDDLLLELSGGAFERVEQVLTDAGYPPDIAEWHIDDES